MRAAPLALIVLVFSSSAPAKDAVDIDSLLSGLQNMQMTGGTCPAPPALNALFMEKTGAPLQTALCRNTGGHPTLPQVCAAATDACASTFHAEGTGSFFDPYCWTTRAPGAFNSQEWRLQVFSHARRFFEDVRTSLDTLKTCCADRPSGECGKDLLKTRIRVVRGLPVADQTLHYDPSSATIRVSEGMLLGCRDQQCVERMILHEFGHACRYRRHPEIGTTDYETHKCEAHSPRYDVLVADSRKVLGQETTDCLLGSLAKTPHGSTCAYAALDEAFANAALAHRYTSITHWSWDCGIDKQWESAIQDYHPRPSSYLGCVLARPRVRDALCP